MRGKSQISYIIPVSPHAIEKADGNCALGSLTVVANANQQNPDLYFNNTLIQETKLISASNPSLNLALVLMLYPGCPKSSYITFINWSRIFLSSTFISKLAFPHYFLL